MKTRLLSVACYLGLAPQLYLFTSNEKRGPLLGYHIQQALALSWLGLLCCLFVLLVHVLEYVVGMKFPGDENIYQGIAVLSLLPCLAWCVLLGAGIWRAGAGSDAPLPLVSRLTARTGVKPGWVVWGLIFQGVCILLMILPFRMNYITRPQEGPASVYMLYPQERLQPLPYTSLGTFTVPRWIFTLGFYPISEVATARWGDGSVSVEPLTRENLNEAFRYGRLVMVASHGGSTLGTIPLPGDPKGYFSPEDILPGGVGPDLQVVYLAGCYIGALEKDWENTLSPARVITFDRISWESEHVFWLWFIGPGSALGLR